MPNLPSERRLHPLSFVFEIAAHGQRLLLPGLFVLFAGARGSDTWQIWVMVLFLPYAFGAVLRALVFRYSFEPDELVIRGGVIFRFERHIPYARIQNIDAIQNLVHRLLRVVKVRLETAGGEEPEGKLNVISMEAYEELRRMVLEGRGHVPAAAAAGAPPAIGDDRAARVADAETPRTELLLMLPPRELMICGLIQGRGLIVIGALFGLVWESGVGDRISGAVFGAESAGGGVVRQLARAMVGRGLPPIGKIALTLGAFAALLIVTRIFSVGWALVRLYGFTLWRTADDLRADFGLFTRVAATVPIRRIQSVTVHEGPLHRFFSRVSVHVDTAGGESDESVKLQRQWLAPVIPREDVPRLLREVLPSVNLDEIEWRPVDPRGVRRARFAWVVLATILSLLLVLVLNWWTPILFGAILLFGMFDARRSVGALGWSLTSTGVCFRSGWLWRRQTIAPFSKIQAVAVHESPFDRRHRMASIAVDTAGTSGDEHGIKVPYLSRATADGLAAQLAAQAASTTFRW